MPIETHITNRQNLLPILLGILAVLIYSLVILNEAINMPKWDDFPDILHFIGQWSDANTLSEKLDVLFYHTNEHILLVNHIVTIAQYALLDHINFAWLIYIGNVFYIGSAWVLWLFFKDKEHSAFAFAIIALLCVNFYPYQSTLWAMTAISNQAVITFSLLAIYLATRDKVNLTATALCSFLAVFSQSNGFLVLPIILIILLRKEKYLASKWLAFSALTALLYFYFFKAPPDSQNIATLNQLPVKNYLLTIPLFFSLLAGTHLPEPSTFYFSLSAIAGFFVAIFVFIQLKEKQFDQPLVYVLVFLLLIFFSMAFYRGLSHGPSILFISRYKMYTAYFLAVAVFLSPYCVQRAMKTSAWFYGLIFTAAAIFSISFYSNLTHSRQTDSQLRQSLERWVEDGDFRRAEGFFIRDTDSYLFPALHKGIWSPMILIADERIINAVKPLEECNQYRQSNANNNAVADNAPSLELTIEHINRNAPGIKVLLSPRESEVSGSTPLEILLCSPRQNYRITVTAKASADSSYPVYYIPAKQIAPGNYQVWFRSRGPWVLSADKLLRKPNTR